MAFGHFHQVTITKLGEIYCPIHFNFLVYRKKGFKRIDNASYIRRMLIYDNSIVRHVQRKVACLK